VSCPKTTSVRTRQWTFELNISNEKPQPAFRSKSKLNLRESSGLTRTFCAPSDTVMEKANLLRAAVMIARGFSRWERCDRLSHHDPRSVAYISGRLHLAIAGFSRFAVSVCVSPRSLSRCPHPCPRASYPHILVVNCSQGGRRWVGEGVPLSGWP
jgi:hypothetical protein